jgi:uncharacterized membrane protein
MVQCRAPPGMTEVPPMIGIEQAAAVIDLGAEWARLVLETLGALTIVLGAASAVVALARSRFAHEHASFTNARFILARYLALALEFQLAADVLETAIAPEWTKIGQLAAIATIRTALNYFLGRELREEREQHETSTPSPAA